MLAVVATGNANTVLNMAHRSHWAAANTGTATVVMLAVDLILVPRIGILGAAIGWSAAMLTDATLGFWQVRLGLGLRSFDVVAVRAGCTVLVAFAGPALALRSAAELAPDGVPAAAVLLLGGLLASGCYLGALAVQRTQLGLDDIVAALRRRPAPLTPGKAT
jgi:O-antigen/teichoic acid export membrane protein